MLSVSKILNRSRNGAEDQIVANIMIFASKMIESRNFKRIMKIAIRGSYRPGPRFYL